MILACKDIHKVYGIDVILEQITFHLEEKEKAAIVGVNGAGKTTLFKIITGEISPDGGSLFLKKDAQIGYLEQNARFESHRTIYDELLSVFSSLLELEQTMRNMEQNMVNCQGSQLEKLMDQYAKLQHDFEQQDGYSMKSRIQGILKGLGFTEEDFFRPMTQLSGGQKTRVLLGKLLLSAPDILLLDEPTNHLDIDSIQWLEDFLKSYPKTVLIISHDRYFMDRIVTKIIEIENKKSTVYEGNYTFYAKQKEINRAVALKQYLDQQKEIKHQEEVIRTLRSFNREKSIKRAESREKSLEKMQRLEKPENLPSKMRLSLAPRISSGKDVLLAENLSKSFGQNHLFSHVNLDIKREEKIALIGPNGVGKTTLFRILLSQESQDTGTIKLGANVKIGYYDQEQQNLTETNTIFQEIHDAYPSMTNVEIRNALAAFVFTGEDIFKPISSLSGGEKGRVCLAKIMLSEANFLLLDEPTNHLDMVSKEILEDAVNQYTGTVLYISHDRYFIDRTAQKVLELTNNGVNQYLGNYSYYLEKKNQKEREQYLAQLDQPKAPAAEKKESEAKQEWRAKKEEQAKQRKLANQIKKTEQEIEETEQEIARLDNLLFQDEVSTNPDRAREVYEEKTALEKKLESLYEQWETLQS